MARIVVDQHFQRPLTEDDYTRTARRLDVRLDEHGAAWRRSYLSQDRFRMTCEFEARDVDAVRDAYLEADVPFDAIWGADVSSVEDYPELLEKLNEVETELEELSTRRTRRRSRSAEARH